MGARVCLCVGGVWCFGVCVCVCKCVWVSGCLEVGIVCVCGGLDVLVCL